MARIWRILTASLYLTILQLGLQEWLQKRALLPFMPWTSLLGNVLQMSRQEGTHCVDNFIAVV